jgi:hypothetical protein
VATIRLTLFNALIELKVITMVELGMTASTLDPSTTVAEVVWSDPARVQTFGDDKPYVAKDVLH